MIPVGRARAPVVFAILALAFSVALPAASRRSRQEKPPERKPRLRLVAEPAVGFTPVATTLTGQLSGIDSNDSNFCHAAVTWTRIDPGQSEEEGLKIREDPACLHPKEQVSVPTSFSRSWTLYSPGSYLFRLSVEGKDRTRITSGYAKVEVLRIQ
jgi:hypothetical protein